MLQEIKKVFSTSFQEDVKYLEFKRSMRPCVKLKNESESIDEKVERLNNSGYKSNCSIQVGDFQ